jgi:hypothetical protein
MWKNIVEPGKPQKTIKLMRIACWIPKATNKHSEYVILTAFSGQQWLQQRATIYRTLVVLLISGMRSFSL